MTGKSTLRSAKSLKYHNLKAIMPQFDLSSFPVQIFWLFFLFITLYFMYVYKFLPMHLFLLKLRKKLSMSKVYSNASMQIKDINQLKIDK